MFSCRPRSAAADNVIIESKQRTRQKHTPRRYVEWQMDERERVGSSEMLNEEGRGDKRMDKL